MKTTRIILFASFVTGCAGLIGVPDLTFDEQAPQGNPDAQASSSSGSSGSSGTSGAPGDGGGGACNANLQTDPNHCGRCDHACGGGTCTAGKCDPVTLVSAVGGPEQTAVDGTFLYFAASAENAIRRIKKDGTGTVETVLSGPEVDRVRGLALDGTTLYYSGDDRLHRCQIGAALDSCSKSKATIADLYFIGNITYANGNVFSEANGELYRTATNDAGTIEMDSKTIQQWGLAATNDWLYHSSLSVGLHRIRYDGGGEESVGPLNSAIRGSYVTIDGDSVFWAFKEDGTDAGQVFGQKLANTADRLNYTSNGGFPIGIAADAQYVYWADQGGTGAGNTSLGNGVLFACPRGGCGAAPLILATGLKGGGPIVLDDKAVYFVENDGFSGSAGRIRKVAKP